MDVEVRAPLRATGSAHAQPGLDARSVTQELPVPSGHGLELSGITSVGQVAANGWIGRSPAERRSRRRALTTSSFVCQRQSGWRTRGSDLRSTPSFSSQPSVERLRRRGNAGMKKRRQ